MTLEGKDHRMKEKSEAPAVDTYEKKVLYFSKSDIRICDSTQQCLTWILQN